MVTNEPIFLSSMTLRENILYGCDKPVTDSVIWHLCQTLGRPRHIFNPQVGSMPMGGVSLAPIERQLLSVVRTLITQPDVLVVHDLGALEPSVALRLGNISALRWGMRHAPWARSRLDAARFWGA